MRLSYDKDGGNYASRATGSNNGAVWRQQITAPLDADRLLTLCRTYGYDNFNHPTASNEIGGWSRTNSYGAFGNRTVNVGFAQTISPLTNRITAVAQMAPPQYDKTGI